MKYLSLNILDIARNSLRAGATEIKLEIEESRKKNRLVILLKDNGKGIDAEMLKTVDDPYTTSRKKRNIGMGIPLLKYHAEIAGGGIEIDSEEGKGTCLKASFELDHVDRQPLGDLAGVVRILLSADRNVNFQYQHQTDSGVFRISSEEIKQELGISEINDNNLLSQISELIKNNLEELGSENQ